ncbi:MAG: coenzyme F420-0:L-glutamate ligase [Anaerolineae bacterium]|nr:coenzyme F420-0:L-glutamate ligase [Anaerolineae bacterium]
MSGTKFRDQASALPVCHQHESLRKQALTTTAGQITLFAIPGIPEIRAGDNLAGIILQALDTSAWALQTGDVMVVTQKIVSKAEGCTVNLAEMIPSRAALTLADIVDKDPRLVEVILRESRQVIRQRHGTLIMETHHGWICANAGVDRSNVPGEDIVLTLPRDPDLSAQQLRDSLETATGVNIAVIITDTHGRAWRLGAVNLTIGCAGLLPISDFRGQTDRDGYILHTTTMARADELAAAAGLLSGQADEGLPVVIIRGAPYTVGDGRAVDMQRSIERDLFR